MEICFPPRRHLGWTSTTSGPSGPGTLQGRHLAFSTEAKWGFAWDFAFNQYSHELFWVAG
jgi:hypothetical protein